MMLSRLPILFSALILSACSEPAVETEPRQVVRFVKTMTVSSSAPFQSTELPGVVAANREAELSFRISGKVEDLLVKEGDRVVEGQLLAGLDDADIRIQLRSDQAQYDKALADFRRGQALVGKGTISQSEYNRLESSYAAAEAALDGTKQNLLYSTLEAPFSGIIAKRYIDNFEEIQAKQTILVLQDVSTIDIKLNVPERIMIRTANNNVPDVVAIFDAIPNQTFPLVFKEAALQADTETNTYEVTMSMSKVEGYNILPGMSVTARATRKIDAVSNRSTSMYVPTQAVLEDSKGRYTFVAIPTQDNRGTIQRRDIVTGKLSSLGLEIVSGLEEGEELVVAGMSKMYDGLEVRIDGK